MLSNQQLNEIKELQNLCEEYDGIQLKLNWPTLETREEMCEIPYYEDKKLVAFIAYYKFGNEVEICGMVHPDYRRKGLFTLLFSRLLTMFPEDEPILLNAPADSAAAKGWLESVQATYAFSEMQMKWRPGRLEQLGKEVTLRNAAKGDIPTMMELDKVCFGIEDAAIKDYEKTTEEAKLKQDYLIEAEGKAIGKIHLSRLDGESWITGFAIYPDKQGNGYGKTALIKTVLQLSADGCEDIRLEVALKNKNALRLYEQCGFKAYHTQDYYLFGR
ncbi:GNAT family N-acetyltransferase [Bacillus sp. 1P06AnD]|uniref:GNAT family N-acetyltransferase n=1 Tax=Bacillus sp. 1P06AnD TaxID=3132208 RepID=UPI0039A3178E